MAVVLNTPVDWREPSMFASASRSAAAGIDGSTP
jgi:hypothetical protein